MEYVRFKQGDLVYCKKFNVISFLKPMNGNIFTLQIIWTGRTYTSEGFHQTNDAQPSLIKLDTYLTRRLCEKNRRSLDKII